VEALRWVDVGADATLEVRLPSPGGLGVRRTALSAALLARAREAGAEVREVAALDHRRSRDAVMVETPAGAFRGRLLVAADGLASPVRCREGLDLGATVEVHLGDGVEAYLTPAGAGRTGVAFLFDGVKPGGWEGLLARFPSLARRLEGAATLSEDRGAGPLVRRARARVLDRLVLLGDAGGSLDPLSGEGLSLGLGGALDLAALAPEAIAAGATRAALIGYERAWARRWRRAALATSALVALAHRPGLRRTVMAAAARAPGPLERLVALASC
jgi:flavin-dependent dehydrogenase